MKIHYVDFENLSNNCFIKLDAKMVGKNNIENSVVKRKKIISLKSRKS